MLITELLLSCIRNPLIKVHACPRPSSEKLVHTETGTVTDTGRLADWPSVKRGWIAQTAGCAHVDSGTKIVTRISS